MITRRYPKYTIVEKPVLASQGSSAGLDPRYVKDTKLNTKNQKKNLLKGSKALLLITLLLVKGIINNTTKLKTSANSPVNLVGKNLSIA